MLDVYTIRSNMTSPTDPNGPSLENIHPMECKCGATRHLVNKELPRLRLHDKDAVDRVMEEAQQLHMFELVEDLQAGDIREPKRLSTINDILEVLKLLARKV